MKRIIILFALALVISQGLVCLAQEGNEPTLTPEPPVEVESPPLSPESLGIELIPIPTESPLEPTFAPPPEDELIPIIAPTPEQPNPEPAFESTSESESTPICGGMECIGYCPNPEGGGNVVDSCHPLPTGDGCACIICPVGCNFSSYSTECKGYTQAGWLLSDPTTPIPNACCCLLSLPLNPTLLLRSEFNN